MALGAAAMSDINTNCGCMDLVITARGSDNKDDITGTISSVRTISVLIRSFVHRCAQGLFDEDHKSLRASN